MTQTRCSVPHRTLPFQRSPCRRAGGSSGTRSREAGDHGLDVDGLVGGDPAAVAGELEVRQHPPLAVELRPGGRRLVEEGQAGDEAVALGAVRRGAGEMGGGQRPAEGGRGVRGRAARLDPAQDQAALVGGQHLRDVEPALAGRGQPAQAVGLRGEEPVGRVVERLHQGGGAVGEAQLGRHAHVPAVDGSGGHDGTAEELLGVPGDQRLAGHGCRPRAAATCCGEGGRGAVDHGQHLLESGITTVVRVRYVAIQFIGRVHRIEGAEEHHPG